MAQKTKKKRARLVADPDTCVCGRARENPGERRLLHCRVCSNACAKLYRSRHAERIAAVQRQRRKMHRELTMPKVAEENAADSPIVRAARDAVLVRVWIHRGLVSRETCRCGRSGQPHIIDQTTKAVLWRCVRCETPAEEEAITTDTCVPFYVAPAGLALDRTTIAEKIATLPDPVRRQVLAATSVRRPSALPATMWERSVMWRDAAIAAYRELVSE
jgi:hypothetical protein